MTLYNLITMIILLCLALGAIYCLHKVSEAFFLYKFLNTDLLDDERDDFESRAEFYKEKFEEKHDLFVYKVKAFLRKNIEKLENSENGSGLGKIFWDSKSWVKKIEFKSKYNKLGLQDNSVKMIVTISNEDDEEGKERTLNVREPLPESLIKELGDLYRAGKILGFLSKNRADFKNKATFF